MPCLVVVPGSRPRRGRLLRVPGDALLPVCSRASPEEPERCVRGQSHDCCCLGPQGVFSIGVRTMPSPHSQNKHSGDHERAPFLRYTQPQEQ